MKGSRLLLLLISGAAVAGLAACSSRPAGQAAAGPDPARVADLLTRAKALYAQREELDRVREAVGLLQQALAADPANYEATWQLAKLNYYLAAHASDKAERDAAYNQGIDAGREAVRLQPERPDGHFWLGANLGGRAQSQGALSGLASVGDVRREMETVIRLDEAYQNGSAYMVLGQIDLKLPALAGGDKKRAVELLETGLRFGQENAFLRLRLAAAYLEVNRKEEARKQLNAILSMKPHPDYEPEYKEAAAEARRLLERKLK